MLVWAPLTFRASFEQLLGARLIDQPILERRENWRRWNPDIVRLQTSDPLELGSTARIRLRGSPPMTFVVT